MMDSNRFNNWLSLLANFGVVAGLAMLVIEINQTNNLAEAEAAQERSDQISQAQKDFAISEHLPGIVVKYQESGIEALTAVEISRYKSWELARRSRMSAQYRQYLMGYLDQETAERTVLDAALSFANTWDDLGLETDGANSSLDALNSEFWQKVQEAQRQASID
jgi:hypothetical protein